jgi:hypothetical protein
MEIIDGERLMKKILCICLLAFLTSSLLTMVSASNKSEYAEVNLQYLAAHMEEFYGQKVRVNGTVSLMTSTYMYEDFWLDKTIPVVERSADLPVPSEGSFIEILGTIEHSSLEGGFYYLNADTYAENIAPEFPQSIIISLFMAATLLTLIAHKKRTKLNQDKKLAIT